MKPCMVGDVDLQLDDLKWVNLHFWVPISFIILWRSFISYGMLETTYSRQKSYARHRRRELEFEEGYKVYLKILPMKGVVRFRKKENLNPRYVGPYEMLQ